MYNLVRTVIDLFFRLLARRTITGMENVPPTGPVLLVTNHLSMVDPPLIFTGVLRPDMVVFVASKYRKNAFFRFVIESVGGVWIDRGNVDRAALKTSLDVLKRGGLLGIAPEGTRSPAHALQAGKTGAAFLATRANVPVLPVAVAGTERALGELRRLRRPRVTLTIGKPFSLPAVSREARMEQLEEHTTEIMCRIAALLPQEYRGVYAEHPRVRALEAETEGRRQ